MSGFDWLAFLRGVNVDHEIGPKANVRAGHVGIDCLLCGDDTKKHFSIELESGRIRGCWRDRSHWIGPTELVSRLARVTHSEAKRILETQDVPVDVSTGDLQAQLDQVGVRERSRLPAVEWPREMKPFTPRPSLQEGRFHAYLERRGFSDAHGVASMYGLRWCFRGRWTNRIAFPLLDDDGNLVGWSARAITPSKRRYLVEPSGDAGGALLWGVDPSMEGGTLIVCEGPFDALKIDYYAGRRPVYAVALLTNGAGPAKVARLARLADRFDRLVILLDRGAEGPALDLRDALQIIRPEVRFVPEGAKDPGEMTPDQIVAFLDELSPKP